MIESYDMQKRLAKAALLVVGAVSVATAQVPAISMSRDASGKTRTFIAGQLNVSQAFAALLRNLDNTIFTCTLVQPLQAGDVLAVQSSDDQVWSVNRVPLAGMPNKQYSIIAAVTPADGDRRVIVPALVKFKRDIESGAVLRSDDSPAVEIETQRAVKAGQSIPVFFVTDLLVRAVPSVLSVEDAARPPSDLSIRAYYDAHKSEMDQIHAWHILIRFQGSPVPQRLGQKDLTGAEALQKAKDLRVKILAGAKFAELAQAESDDIGAGANGGDLGTFARGTMLPEFEKVAFALPVGQVSDPVRTPFGYHLILVQSRAAKSFEEARPDIEKSLGKSKAGVVYNGSAVETNPWFTAFIGEVKPEARRAIVEAWRIYKDH